MGKHDNVFIDKYETIRQMLLQLFLFGCYDRQQGARLQQVSGSSYSENTKRVKYFWPEKIIENRKITGKKISRFPFNRYTTTDNYLQRSFQIKAFNIQDINLYFFIMETLADGESKSINEILSIIEDHVFTDDSNEQDITDDTGIITYTMLQSNLLRMTSAGFLKETGEKPFRYQLYEDILSNFTEKELYSLYDTVFEYKNLLPLTTLGYRVQDVIHDTLVYSLGENLSVKAQSEDKYFFIQSILNEEIVYLFIIAHESHRKISFQLPYKGEVFENVIPLKFIFDHDYGRQFLVCSNAEHNTFIRRLDQISDFRILKETFDNTAYISDTNILDHIWNASLRESASLGEPVLLKVDFHFDSKHKELLKRRLHQEKRMGTLHELSDTHWLFEVSVYDPNELIPWIRSFGKYARIRESQDFSLNSRLMDEWNLLRQCYSQNHFPNAPATISPPLPKQKPFPAAENQPELFTEYRNAYYRGIQQIYTRITLDGEKYTKESILEHLRKHSFPIPKDQKAHDRFSAHVDEFHNHIRKPALFRKKKPSPYLYPSYGFDIETDGCENTPPIPFLLMTDEKRWLRSLLQIPAARCRLGDSLSNRLEKAINCLPFPFSSVILHRGTGLAQERTESSQTSSKESQLHLIIRPIYQNNDIDRCFLIFSTHSKEGWKDDETGLYHLLISYKPIDEMEILQKILSLGAAVKILEPVALREKLLQWIP